MLPPFLLQFVYLNANYRKLDREDALRDDFTLDAGYDYVDEDEWDERDVAWNGDEEAGSAGDDESPETKDESAAYLEFLNEEVSFQSPLRAEPLPTTAPANTKLSFRHKSSAASLTTTMRRSSEKTAFFSNRHWIRSSHTSSSGQLC